MTDTLPLENPQLLEKYLEQVTVERREKVARMKSIQAQALSIGSEILIQKALFQSFGINKELIITKDSQGKPSLLNYPEIHFNLSHSGNYAVCALAGEAVGVDLQKMDRHNLELAKRYFADEEVKWLFDLPFEKQIKGFFDLWAIKESYMKYTGKGFALSMKGFMVRIECEFPEEIRVAIFEGEKKMDVFLKKYGCPEDYVLWCCTDSNHFEEVLEWVSLEEEV